MSVRIGLIGAGFGRRVQLPALRLVPGAQVVAVASSDPERAAQVARELDIPRAFADAEQLARADGIDVVIVSSPPHAHARYAVAALEAGKHVLCEKPAALDATEARRMLAASERRPGQVAWIDHELRYEPNRRKLRELLRGGAIGELRHVELSLMPYRRSDGRAQLAAAPWDWWSDASCGGGLLGANGSHAVDLCRWWTGSEVEAVAGCVATFIPERMDGGGAPRRVTADDFTSFVLRMANGVVATITLSGVAHHGPGHVAHLTGSDGTLVLTGESDLAIGRPGGPLESVSQPDDLRGALPADSMWARSFVRLARDLVRVIDGAEPDGMPPTFRDGWLVQRTLDAVRSAPGAVRQARSASSAAPQGSQA